MPGSSHQPPGPQASSAPDMARGRGDLLSHGMRLNSLYPPCPGSRHSQILWPTQSKHVANVLSEYVSRRGGWRQSQRHTMKMRVRESVLKTVWAPQPIKAGGEGNAGCRADT